MAHPSHAPRACTTLDTEDATAGSSLRLRRSRLPAPNANIRLDLVDETFRRLGKQPPASADNDTLTEAELFAIWTARLL